MKLENKTVISMVANNESVTLYFDDGESESLPTNQEFTREVLDIVVPALDKGETVLLNMENKTLDIFSLVEKRTNGLVKFFRVAKKALLGVEAPTEEQIVSIALPMELYQLGNEEETIVAVYDSPPPAAPAETQGTPSNEETDETVRALGSGNAGTDTSMGVSPAGEATDPRTSDTSPPEEVSLVRNQRSVLVGAEQLKNQVNHFSKEGNPDGFMAFLRRLDSVLRHRGHTAQELMDFLSKADLPIADDGCIVAYKRLSIQGDRFVDSHSRTVKQRVGSKVSMPVEMVDANRRNECSNGLHIGRRDYMGNFHGGAIVIVKIAPEDVVAVPQDYQGSKMRCAGYHIVGQLNAKAFSEIIKNRAMTSDEETAQMLTDIIRGNHIGVIEDVRIERGGITITVHEEVESSEIVDTRAQIAAEEEAAEARSRELEAAMQAEEDDLDDSGIEPEDEDDEVEEEHEDEPEVIAPVDSPAIPEAPVEAPKPKAKRSKTVKALEDVTSTRATIDKEVNSVKAIKAKRKAAIPEEVLNNLDSTMTANQQKAKARWHEIAEGKISKVKLAKECGTSARSLDRWAEKFNF